MKSSRAYIAASRAAAGIAMPWLFLMLLGCTAAPSGAAAVSPSGVPAASSGASTVTVTGAVLTPGPIAFPVGFMPSVKSYGAVGDGVTDDTAAIQEALDDGRPDSSVDYDGLPKALYFPPGTYLIHDTLAWNGCCVTLQGDGSSASVIRLAPGSPGFGDSAVPKPLIQTPKGNTSFRQNIWDIGIAVGSGNPGAVGIDYVANNSASMHNVAVVSEDGEGIAGIALQRAWAGPLLLKNVSVHGFASGIVTAYAEYGITGEGITLSGQGTAGINNNAQTLMLRSVASSNAVPAIVNSGGFVVLLDAALTGGSTTHVAVQNTAGLYLRNVQSTGYEATLQDTNPASKGTLSGAIREYVSGGTHTLNASPSVTSLGLAVSETPTYSNADMTQWAAFQPKSYGDTTTLQATLNSGAAVVYFPFGRYFAYNQTTVTVPDTVQRIVGFSSIVNQSTAGTNGGGIRFVVSSGSTQPLIIDEFGYGVTVEQDGSRPVVIGNGDYSYVSGSSAGPLYLEDVATGALDFQPGQTVWARQLDDEINGTKITNAGTLWMLGLKTEEPGTVVNTLAGGKTELLGGLIYPVRTLPLTAVAFEDSDAEVSYMYNQLVYCTDCGYQTQVEESMQGVVQTISANPSRNFAMSLFSNRGK